MDVSQEFRGKRITLMGLGLLGRGVGDAGFLADCGAHVIVTDKKSADELAPSVTRLSGYPNIELHLGRHYVEDFTRSDMVIKAAGVPLDSPEIKAARAANVPVVMSTALFAQHVMKAGVKVVGVTGTRGKSTVTQMIFHALKQVGKRVHIGGNIRGISTLALFPDVEPGDIVILELDSWQLQGFGYLHISPHIAVFTNLMSDHQNYYPDMDAYFSDKANIFRYQSSVDSLFVGNTVVPRIKPVLPYMEVPQPIPADWKLKIIGEHNRENASFAVAALEALGISSQDIRKGLESFEGVEGRLQFVRELDGVRIYNDNNSTTPEATVAALRALGKDTTLIIGGSEKGLALEELAAEIKKSTSRVILLTHENYRGSVRLAEALTKAGIVFVEARDLATAVDDALTNTKGGSILFSPAFASFGMFKNEYERNDEFLRLVRTKEDET